MGSSAVHVARCVVGKEDKLDSSTTAMSRTTYLTAAELRHKVKASHAQDARHVARLMYYRGFSPYTKGDLQRIMPELL